MIWEQMQWSSTLRVPHVRMRQSSSLQYLTPPFFTAWQLCVHALIWYANAPHIRCQICITISKRREREESSPHLSTTQFFEKKMRLSIHLKSEQPAIFTNVTYDCSYAATGNLHVRRTLSPNFLEYGPHPSIQPACLTDGLLASLHPF